MAVFIELLFVVLMVFEHLVKENVNGVSAMSGRESIRFRDGCVNDDIWKLKCVPTLGFIGVEDSVAAVDFIGKPSVERLT